MDTRAQDIYQLLTPRRELKKTLLLDKPIAVAVAGGSAVGKTAFAFALANTFYSVNIISENDYCVANS